MKLITDTGEFNILNVRVIDTEMKTIYIEEKPKGFMILISNKIIDNKSDMKLLTGFEINLDDEYLEVSGFDIRLKIKKLTKLNIDSKLLFLEELGNNEYRLTFSSNLIENIRTVNKILINF